MVKARLLCGGQRAGHRHLPNFYTAAKLPRLAEPSSPLSHIDVICFYQIVFPASRFDSDRCIWSRAVGLIKLPQSPMDGCNGIGDSIYIYIILYRNPFYSRFQA